MQEQDETRKQQLEMRLEIQKEAVVAAALAGELTLSADLMLLKPYGKYKHNMLSPNNITRYDSLMCR